MASISFVETSDVPEGLVTLFAKSAVSLSIADYTREDCPLVGVNQHFLDLCEYEADDVLGRNCRFLQPEGGAGPVRDRMRQFLQSGDKGSEKFVVPNVTKHGEPFLNLIYLAKLQREGETALVLGSQFSVARDRDKAYIYDQALSEDLRHLSILTSENNWAVLGTFEALASSHSIIAQAQIDGG